MLHVLFSIENIVRTRTIQARSKITIVSFFRYVIVLNNFFFSVWYCSGSDVGYVHWRQLSIRYQLFDDGVDVNCNICSRVCPYRTFRRFEAATEKTNSDWGKAEVANSIFYLFNNTILFLKLLIILLDYFQN